MERLEQDELYFIDSVDDHGIYEWGLASPSAADRIEGLMSVFNFGGTAIEYLGL